MDNSGISRIIYTDILKDGMMQGPNVETTRQVARHVEVPVTASGGISSLDDVTAVRAIQQDGVDELIIGRALYLNKFTLAEAIEAGNTPPAPAPVPAAN
jgi:phosphoribosylformimino-5-aminoimidazole carboxamide ribonucleotide (ProFAR) isomerase